MKNIRYSIDKSSDIPLYVQLSEQLKRDILSGRIADGEKLPSRRELTEKLRLSKNTVELAYRRLIDEGYAVSRSRSGYYARQTSPVNTNISEPDFYGTPGISYVMSQNGTDLDAVPYGTLIKLCRDISYDMPELFKYGHKYGESQLRKAIAQNLYDLHGISCTPDRIIIGAGPDFLLQQLACALGENALFGFENPCFARSYVPLKNIGAATELIDTEMDRFPIEKLKQSGITVMYLSPDMQFPTARRLSEEQRNEILAWAEAEPDRYIIEADFDLDFSEDPGSALAAKNPEKVIFLGSFYRGIAPSMNVAFVMLPKAVKDAFNQRLPYYTCLKSRLEQQVIAEFIRSGKYRSHTEKLRKLYREKRRILKSALMSSPLAPYIKIHGVNSGTYFVISVENGMNETELKEAAAKRGVKMISLSACFITMNELLPRNAFIIGFGELTAEQIKGAAACLIRAWAI